MDFVMLTLHLQKGRPFRLATCMCYVRLNNLRFFVQEELSTNVEKTKYVRCTVP